MAVYEHERDLLEDTVLLYRRLVSKWSEFSDAYAVFDQHNPIQLCVCFITAGPITKLCAWGEEESGGHVL